MVPALVAYRGSAIAGADERDREVAGGHRVEGLDGGGSDLSRLLSLSDGVFAFSLTFLAVTLLLPQVGAGAALPALPSYLWKLEPAFVGYLLSFFVIGSWWSGHQRLFSAFARYDETIVRLNSFFLLTVSITPFLVSLLFAYSPDGFGRGTISDELAVVLYAAVQGVGGLSLYGIWRHALGHRRLLKRELPERWIRVTEANRRTTPLVFLASMAVAFVSPLAAELAWIVMIVQLRRLSLQVARKEAGRPRPGEDVPPGAGTEAADAGRRDGETDHIGPS